jgi:AcrR family transcriptional regulator
VTNADARDVKLRLVEVTVEEIADRGWGGVRMRRVAARAGLDNGLVHCHFGSMDRLRYHAARHAISTTVTEADRALLAGPSPGAGIVAFCRVLTDLGSYDAAKVALMEAPVHAPRLSELCEVLTSMMERFPVTSREQLEAAVQSGRLPPATNAEGLAVMLAALLDGLSLHHWLQPEVDYATAAGALAALLDDDMER